jgi:thiamine-phosphate pyrophosphorylase
MLSVTMEPMSDGSHGTGDERRARLRAARLYLVVESRVRGASSQPIVAAALAGGVDVVQLRDKQGSDGEVVTAGRRLAATCRQHGALLIVNDRPDLAVEAGADGVHVGQDDTRVDRVRAEIGRELLIGLSTHSPGQIAAASHSEADYLGVGPVYSTATKPELEPVGLELVRHAAVHARQPFFAIGGIDARRAREVAEAGAERVAVVRAIRDAEDPRAAARSLREALEREPVGGAAV